MGSLKRVIKHGGAATLFLALLFSGFEAHADEQPIGASKAQIKEFVESYLRLQGVRSEHAAKNKNSSNKARYKPPRWDEFQGKKISCYALSYLIFYNRNKNFIDRFDTTPYFEEYYDVRKNQKDGHILSDPRQIVVEVQYIIESYKPTAYAGGYDYTKEMELAKQYNSRDGNGAGVCTEYLKIYGLLGR